MVFQREIKIPDRGCFISMKDLSDTKNAERRMLGSAEGALDSESQDEAVLRDQGQVAKCVSLSCVVLESFHPCRLAVTCSTHFSKGEELRPRF